MPGPQMVAAMETSREVRRLHPKVPICWGGYFASIYPDAALNARYVDFVARGQGEDTLIELLDALRGKRSLAHSPAYRAVMRGLKRRTRVWIRTPIRPGDAGCTPKS